MDYVCTHWRDLMDNFETFAGEDGGTHRSAVLIGHAAESLPPNEYLDFLDAYLTVYSKGSIPDGVMANQLAGMERKNCFLVVNAKHSKVKALLERALTLIPAGNQELRDYVLSTASGEGADMYMVNRSDDDPFRPETMPGIRLPSPYESLFERSDRAVKRQLGFSDGIAAEAVSTGTKVRSWSILLGSLLLLGFAARAVVKSRRRTRKPS